MLRGSTYIQRPISFVKKLDNSALVAVYFNGHYCVYYPQTRYPRVDTINAKGTLQELLELVPEGTPVYECSNVPVHVYYTHRMKELDRDAGKVSVQEFIKELERHGAVKI